MRARGCCMDRCSLYILTQHVCSSAATWFSSLSCSRRLLLVQILTCLSSWQAPAVARCGSLYRMKAQCQWLSRWVSLVNRLQLHLRQRWELVVMFMCHPVVATFSYLLFLRPESVACLWLTVLYGRSFMLLCYSFFIYTGLFGSIVFVFHSIDVCSAYLKKTMICLWHFCWILIIILIVVVIILIMIKISL